MPPRSSGGAETDEYGQSPPPEPADSHGDAYADSKGDSDRESSGTVDVTAGDAPAPVDATDAPQAGEGGSFVGAHEVEPDDATSVSSTSTEVIGPDDQKQPVDGEVETTFEAGPSRPIDLDPRSSVVGEPGVAPGDRGGEPGVDEFDESHTSESPDTARFGPGRPGHVSGVSTEAVAAPVAPEPSGQAGSSQRDRDTGQVPPVGGPDFEQPSQLAPPVGTQAAAPFGANVSRETVDPDNAPEEPAPIGPSMPPPGSFERPLPRIIAIANQKGGVGKTTTSVNLSACLAVLGYRVLVVDLDPQGNATTGLGVNPRNLQMSMYDVLLTGKHLDDCIEPTTVRNLFVAPSSLNLAGAEIELVPAMSREQKLAKSLAEVVDDYDFVIIDCPPSLGLLTINGLAAATEVLVPIQCEYYALEGLGQLLRNVSLVRKQLNPDLEVSAIVLVMYDGRTKLSAEVVREVRSHFADQVCRTVVPRTVRLSEAPSYGQPIISFDPSSRGAMAYRGLAIELSGGPSPNVSV